jgi:hypothetical protein
MLIKVFLVVSTVFLLLAGASGCTRDSGVLSPDQVDSSMLDTVVKVKGKITYAVENPMGQGGMYMTLGNSRGEVDVRIQRELWDSYDEKTKSIYREGRTVTVEGILFRAGNKLVVVHGKYASASSPDTSAE